MTTYYLGTTKTGHVVARSSTRGDFTHAAVTTAPKAAGKVIRAGQSTWSTSAAGAASNARSTWRLGTEIEIVPVRIVTGTEYRQAIKGG